MSTRGRTPCASRVMGGHAAAPMATITTKTAASDTRARARTLSPPAADAGPEPEGRLLAARAVAALSIRRAELPRSPARSGPTAAARRLALRRGGRPVEREAADLSARAARGARAREREPALALPLRHAGLGRRLEGHAAVLRGGVARGRAARDARRRARRASAAGASSSAASSGAAARSAGRWRSRIGGCSGIGARSAAGSPGTGPRRGRPAAGRAEVLAEGPPAARDEHENQAERKPRGV
jgi:hypothetical protein